MLGLPNIIRIGGNQKNGLLAICAEKGRLMVLEFPTLNPLDGHREILNVSDTANNRGLLNQKWDEHRMKPQMISHLGLDVVHYEQIDCAD